MLLSRQDGDGSANQARFNFRAQSIPVAYMHTRGALPGRFAGLVGGTAYQDRGAGLPTAVQQPTQQAVFGLRTRPIS